MKNQNPILFLVFVVFTSCAVYQETTLEDSKYKGRVLYSNNGRKVSFKDVIQINGVYYGIFSKDTFRIAQSTASLLLKPNNFKVWVTSNNNNVIGKGYLHEIKDSSIVISFSIGHKQEGVEVLDQYQEFKVKEISKIKIRNEATLRKGYWIGTTIGIGAGITVGALMGVYWIFPAAGTLGILGSIIGLAVGTDNTTILINGSDREFSYRKFALQKMSMVNEVEVNQ